MVALPTFRSSKGEGPMHYSRFASVRRSTFLIGFLLTAAGAACTEEPSYPAAQQGTGLTSLPGLAAAAAAAPVDLTLIADRDTSVRPGALANRNFGQSPTLSVNQSLLAFDDKGFAGLTTGNRQVTAARLEVTVTRNPFSRGDRQIDAFRMTRDWSELRATWNCASDLNPADNDDDCRRADEWAMDAPSFGRRNPWATPATGSAILKGAATGVLRFDVTADVRGFLDRSRANFGWIVKSSAIDDRNVVSLGSHMSQTPPRLVISTQCAGKFADCDRDPANGCEQALDSAASCGACGVSCDDHNPCTADSCGANGTCFHDPVGDGSTCDDGSACTQGDTCHAGVCSGAPVVCGASDQCHAAGTCDPATGACSNPTSTDGTACQDGDACTEADSCQAGVCAGRAIVCVAADQCHTAGTCDQTTGACTSPPIADGSACQDGNACTRGDVCLAGACVGAPIVCAPSDQCHAAGICDPAIGACNNPILADGVVCEDGNACTSADSCQAGRCAGRPVVCTASDQCHGAGTCDATTGACSNPVLADGARCEDGNGCTQGDSCRAGACAGTPVVCSASDQCHGAGTCDATTGACSNPVLADGATCEDGSACTQADSCQGGACVGRPVVCTTSDQCHGAGACDPSTGACTNPVVADGTSCDDNNPCTQGDRCALGVCQVGTPVVCPTADGCHPGVCDQGTGACTNPMACALYGVGAVAGTLRDGLALSPTILQDGTPNNQVGGIGSAIAYSGVDNLYISTPDRGPGGGADSYTDRYYVIDISLADGRVTPTVRGAATLDRGAGLDTFTGLGSAFDATNSTASRRLDPEGVRVGPQGTFFVSDEYGPFVYEFGPDGHRIRALTVPDKFLIDHPGIEDAELPPSNLKGRQANRGMEGLAISPDGSKLYGLMQSPLIQDGALSAANDRIGTNVRLLEIDVATGQTRELLYPLDNPSFGNNEIVAVNDHQFLVDERDGRAGRQAVSKKLMLIDIDGATDISDIAALPSTGIPSGVTPVRKTLFLDLLDPAFALAGPNFPEKIEGLAFGPDLPDGRHVLIVSSDNDFISTQDSQLFVFAIDPRALPGFQAQRGSFPNLCAGPTPVTCPAANVCQLPGICHPGTGACSTPTLPAGSPAGSQVAGDCLRNQCDANGQLVSAVDDTDVASDANQCTLDACLNGILIHPPAIAGTACVQDGGAGATCDGGGRCVACTTPDCAGGTVDPTFRVVRVGEGQVALSNVATAVFIEERRLDGSLVATIPLPVAASGSNLPFAISGSASSEGGMALSGDGHSLAMSGYAATPGTAAIASTASVTTNRVVARIDAAGGVDTSTAVAVPFNTNNVRGAVSADGQGFWMSGAGSPNATGGIWFVPLGGRTGVQVVATPNNVRWMQIFGGQLYGSASSGAFVSVFSIGSGLPMTGPQTATALPGMPVTGSSSPFSFVLLDLNPTIAGPDTLYVADDRAAASGGGVQKWTLNGATWVLTSTLNLAATATPIGFRGLAGTATGTTATLFGSTSDTATRLVVFVDDGRTPAAAGTVVGVAPANTAYRGVALSPRR
jgi:hypothetical protein